MTEVMLKKNIADIFSLKRLVEKLKIRNLFWADDRGYAEKIQKFKNSIIKNLKTNHNYK